MNSTALPIKCGSPASLQIAESVTGGDAVTLHPVSSKYSETSRYCSAFLTFWYVGGQCTVDLTITEQFLSDAVVA